MEDIKQSEVDFFFMNYLSMLGNRLSKDTIHNISKEASGLRDSKQRDYEKYLQELADKCGKASKEKDVKLEPYLNGWSNETLDTILSYENKVILALCHFGEHRHILTDLATLKIPTICPIAGQSYFNYYNLNTTGTELITDYLGLTEVEEDKVSKQLIKSIRQGKIPAIYFDGNMGPENSIKFSNSVDVEFFNKTISVKAGIARIGLLLKYPILPLFATYENVNGKTLPKLTLGEIIKTSTNNAANPSKDMMTSSIMQKLYKQLEEKIIDQPEHWEYALCLHRWCKESNDYVSSVDTTESDNSLSNGVNRYRLNESNATVMKQKGKSCLIDVRNNKGYYPPHWAPQFFDKLASEEGVTTNWIENNTNTSLNQDYLAEYKDIIQMLENKHLIVQEFLAP